MDAAPDPLAPARERLLAEIGVSDRGPTLAGTPAAVLEGGDGRPVILLHGAGELAGTWLPVLGELARAVHVIAPDLPGHGASAMRYAAVDPDWMDRWLDDLIAATCSEPPVLVGRVTGGSIAARYAAGHPRHDLATPVAAAEAAAHRYGWPLHVIDDAGDDPPLDQPDVFLDVLGKIIDLAHSVETSTHVREERPQSAARAVVGRADESAPYQGFSR